MTQLTLDSQKYKNGNARHGRRDERKLSADIACWIAELSAAEALRREQLRQIAKLRAEVYQHARVHGLTPAMLNAARRLLRK